MNHHPQTTAVHDAEEKLDVALTALVAMAPESPTSDGADEDLRDVFRLLYEGDEWEAAAEEETEQPADEVDLVEDSVQLPSDRYSRKRLFSQIDSLLSPGPSRKNRIYTPSTTLAADVVSSTSALPVLPPTDFQPYTALALLARLRTYSPTLFGLDIPPLTPVELARHGWVADGRERVRCGACQASWDISGLNDIGDSDVRKEVARRLGQSVQSRHAPGCGWRVAETPVSLHGRIRRLLHQMLSSSLVPLALALQKLCLTEAINWISPLGEKQGLILASNLSDNRRDEEDSSPIEPCAAGMALFGWSPYASPSSDHVEPSQDQPVDIVHCRICQRRVGLWSFRAGQGSSKAFDLVGEHIGWCPIRETASGRLWHETEASPLLSPAVEGPAILKDFVVISEQLPKKRWRRA